MTLDDIVAGLKALRQAGADRQELLTECAMRGLSYSGIGITASGLPAAVDPTRIGLLRLNARAPAETRPLLKLSAADKADMETMRESFLAGRLAPSDEPRFVSLMNRAVESMRGAA